MGALRDVIAAGLAADRPAAGHAGRLYYSTDTRILERDNGATWDGISPGGGALVQSYPVTADTLVPSAGPNGILSVTPAAGAYLLWGFADVHNGTGGPLVLAANVYDHSSATYLTEASGSVAAGHDAQLTLGPVALTADGASAVDVNLYSDGDVTVMAHAGVGAGWGSMASGLTLLKTG